MIMLGHVFYITISSRRRRLLLRCFAIDEGEMIMLDMSFILLLVVVAGGSSLPVASR